MSDNPEGNPNNEQTLTFPTETGENSGLPEESSDATQLNISKISAYLSIPVEEVQKLDENIIVSLTKKLDDIENLKSEGMILSAKLSKLDVSSSKEMEKLEKKNQGLELHTKKLQEDIKSITEANDQYYKKVRGLSDEINTLTTDKSKLAAAIDSLKFDLESLHKISGEYRALKENNNYKDTEIETLRNQLLSTQRSVENLENEKNKLSVVNNELSHKVQLVEHTSNSYRNELDSKRKQLDEVSISKDNKISEFQSKFSSVSQENLLLKEQFDSVSNSKHELNNKLEKLIMENNSIKNELKIKEEKFANELDLKEKKLKLSEESEKFVNERLDQLTDESNSKIEFLNSKISTLKKDYQARSNLVLEKDARIKELENNLDQLLSNNSMIQSDEDSSRMTNGNGASLSLIPSAKHLAKHVKGLSLSELYSEYSLLKKQLIHEKRLKEMMQTQIDTFVSELEQKIPLIEIINSKNKILEDELRSLSNVLDSETSEKRQLNKQLEITIQEKRESELTVSSLLKTKIDLSKQIQQLLFQLKISNDINSEPLSDYERRELQKMLDSYKVSDKYIQEIQNEIYQRSNETMVITDSDRIISENLVVFNSIQELQTKNAELLKVTRSLITKLELDEKSKQNALQLSENQAVVEYKDTINKLSSEVETLELRLNSAEREKEMYKTLTDGFNKDMLLLSDKPAVESSPEIIHLNEENKRLEKEVSSLEQNLNTVKVETRNIIDDLTKKLDVVNADKYNLSIEIASLKSMEAIQKERSQNLNEKLQFREHELKRVQSTNDQLSGLLSKQEQETSSITVEFRSLKEENDSLKQRVSRLETEISMTLSIKNRIIQENEELKSNKESLNKIVENLQSSNISREAEYNVNNKRLVNMIEMYDQDLKASKEKLNSLEKSIADLNEHHAAELKANSSKMEIVKEELNKVKEELLHKVASEEILTDKCNLLEKQLSSSNAYIDSVTKASKGDNSESSETDKLKEQIKILVSKLANAEEDLKAATDDSSKFKEVASAAETSLASMNQSYDEFKSKMDATTKEYESEVSVLKSEVFKIGEKKTELENQLNEKIKENEELKSEVSALSSKISTTEQIEARFNEKANEIQQSLNKAEDEVKAMRDNYENEIKLHAESLATNKKLEIEVKSIHNKYEALAVEFNSAKERLAAANSNFDSEKKLFEEQIDNLKAELDTRTESDKILRRQLEMLTNNKSKTEDDAMDGVNPENLSTGTERNDHFEELIRLNSIIGREKDLVKSKLEVSEQECAALSIKLRKTEDRLGKVEAEYKQLQISSKDMDVAKNENNRLLTRIEDLSIIRESNSVLRNELTTKNNQITQLESKLIELGNEKEPLQHQINTLASEIELKQQEIQSLKSENKDWENKLQTILTTFDKVDPTQYKKLQEDNSKLDADLKNIQAEVATLRQQRANDIKSKESLKNKFNEALKNKNTELVEISKKLENAKVKSEELTTKITKLEEEKSELQKKFIQASSSKSTNNKKATALTNKVAEQTATITQLNSKITELNAKIDALNKSNHALNEENVSFDQEINDLTVEKEKMVKEHQEAVAALNDQISISKSQIEELLSKAESKTLQITGTSDNASIDANKMQELKREFDNRLSEIKKGFEEEKAKIAEDLNKSKSEEIKKLAEELEKTRSELAKKAASSSNEKIDAVDVEALKKKWLEEQEPKILERITNAENELRNKFELPVREAINKRADFKFENYKKKYEEELKETIEKQIKADFDKSINEIEKINDEKLSLLVSEYESKLKTSVEEALKTKNENGHSDVGAQKEQTDPEDLKKLRDFMDNQKKNEIDELMKKHQSELTNKFNQGQKTGQLKAKILEGKIKKLEEKLRESGIDTSANTSPVKAVPVQTNKSTSVPASLPESIPVLPKIPTTKFAGNSESDNGAEQASKKRSFEQVSDSTENEEKRSKTEE